MKNYIVKIETDSEVLSIYTISAQSLIEAKNKASMMKRREFGMVGRLHVCLEK